MVCRIFSPLSVRRSAVVDIFGEAHVKAGDREWLRCTLALPDEQDEADWDGRGVRIVLTAKAVGDAGMDVDEEESRSFVVPVEAVADFSEDAVAGRII